MSDEYFVGLVRRAMSELSPEHMDALEHVAIIVANEPSEEQRQRAKLRGDQTLLGLYEGVPLTHRGGYESGLLPDTITIFKQPLLAISHSEARLYEEVKRTVWHEIANYFGISHAEMERRMRKG